MSSQILEAVFEPQDDRTPRERDMAAYDAAVQQLDPAMDARCDMNQVPPWVRQPKPLDCGHEVRGSDVYITWLETNEDVCLVCATEDRSCIAE